MTVIVLLPVAALVAWSWRFARSAGTPGWMLLTLGAVALLLAELAALMAWLGRVFDKMEPSQVPAA